MFDFLRVLGIVAAAAKRKRSDKATKRPAWMRKPQRKSSKAAS